MVRLGLERISVYIRRIKNKEPHRTVLDSILEGSNRALQRSLLCYPQ